MATRDEEIMTLERALIITIQAAKKAEDEACRIGYPFRFSSSDIREMAITVLNQGERVA